MKRIRYSVACVLLTLCVLLCGCPRSKPVEPTPPSSPNAPETDPNAGDENKLDLAIQDEAPLPASALSQLPSVQETLEQMIGAYKNLDSYSDQAICQVSVRRGEEISDQSSPFYFSFIKPNKMRYVSRTCEIRADGKTISVFIPTLPGVILQRPCPEELHLEDILFDQAIDEAIFMSQPSLFSVLPLQWIMFFADDPLKTLTFGQKEIRALSPQEIDGRPCYRLRFDREDGSAILWIDQKTGLILRAQLPTEGLVNSVEGDNVNDCSLTIEFGDPQINGEIPDVAFAMEIPVGTNVTDNYVPPTTQLLGTQFPDFQFSKLDDGGSVNNDSVKGKIAVVNFWATWSKLEPSVQPQLNQLRQKYENDPDVVFLSVSIDESSVSDPVLRDALKQWNSPLDSVRDDAGFLAQELKITAVPAVFVLNKDGTIESLEMGFTPILVNEVSECIDQIRNGESPSKTTLKNKQTETEQYEKHRKEWLQRGIFVDEDVIQMAGIPETVAAQSSQPSQFELKLLWVSKDVQNPGALLADGEAPLPNRADRVGSQVEAGSAETGLLGDKTSSSRPYGFAPARLPESAPDGRSDSRNSQLATRNSGCVWVLENGKKVVQIDSEGHIKSRIDLDLNPKEICSFIRKSSLASRNSQLATRNSEACFLAFAPGQQRIHVYDQNWKNLFHYPDNALDNPHDGIQDARFGDLTNDNNEEIYIAYLGTRGVESVDLQGRLRWSNRTLGTVFSVAPYHSQNENLVLCCAGSSGMITVLQATGKTLGDKNNIGVIGLKDNLAAMVYSAKMKNESDNDAPDRVGSQVEAGSAETGLFGDKTSSTRPRGFAPDDSLCALCANQNAYMLVGFNMRSEILWTYELPQGIPKRPIDYLTSADVMPNGDSIWIALGSDGSIHFIDADGMLIDRFNHGQFVYGLTTANWNGQRVLILSDEQGVKAYQIIWK